MHEDEKMSKLSIAQLSLFPVAGRDRLAGEAVGGQLAKSNLQIYPLSQQFAIMALDLALAVAVIAFSLLFYFVYNLRNSKSQIFMKQVSGPPRLPFLGNALDVNLTNEGLTELFQFQWPVKYGPRYSFAIANRNYFSSTKPSDIEKLLSSPWEINKGRDYDFITMWLGEGLLTSKGSKWFTHRKMLTPSFHFKILEEFAITFNKNAAIFMEELQKASEGGKKVINIFPFITRCALDIICETAMGKPIHAQKEKDSDYVRAVYAFGASALHRAMRPWLGIDFVYYNFTSIGRQEWKNVKLLHEFTESVIKEKKKERELLGSLGSEPATEVDNHSEVFMTKKRAVAFMDLLLDVQAKDPSSLTDLEIREETDTFMFEGHDTTAASLAWTILLLGSNPDCQDKVLAELDGIFGSDKERPITMADLTQMKYLEYCIKESLRLFPSVPFMSRVLRQDMKLDNEVTVPAGFNFTFFTLSVHRNPEIFPDPEAFKPERFEPENAVGRHPYAYIPFSAGPRNCIGQKFALAEEKVILAHLFRNFRVEAVRKREDTTIMMEIITRPKDGVIVKLTPR